MKQESFERAQEIRSEIEDLKAIIGLGSRIFFGRGEIKSAAEDSTIREAILEKIAALEKEFEAL